MSKTKKEQRASQRADREKKQAQRVINWIVGGLIILFVVGVVLAMSMYN